MSDNMCWSDIELSDGSMSLVFGSRGRQGLEAVRIDTANEVSTALRGFASDTLESFRGLSSVAYEETASIEPSEQYFAYAVQDAATPASSEESASPDQEGVEAAQLLTILSDPAALETTTAAQLKRGDFLFYAAIFESALGTVSFVKIQQQLRLATASKIYATLGETLKYVSEPIFAFSNIFDLLITDTEIAFRNPKVFERLFSDLDLVAASVPHNLATLSSNLPFDLGSDLQALLLDACSKRISLAKAIRRLGNVDYLAEATIQNIKEELDRYHDLPAGINVTDDGKLEMSESGVKTFVQLLEQRFWNGPFDSKTRVANTFQQLSQ